MKLSHAVEGFFLEKRLDCSEATIDKYAYVFRRFIEFVGDIEAEAVTSVQVRMFLNHLRLQHKEQPDRKELSRRTLHDYWSPLSSFWTWAENELGVEHIIRGKVPAPGYTERVIEPASLPTRCAAWSKPQVNLKTPSPIKSFDHGRPSLYVSMARLAIGWRAQP